MAGDLGFETTTWARRIGALVVDWVASTLAVVLVIGSQQWSQENWSGFVVLATFVVESALLTATAGGSFGQLLTRLRVVRTGDGDGDPRPPDLLRALVRQVLVALVIPPLVYRPDGRGLHDIAASTATVDLQTFDRLRAATGRPA